MLDLGYVAAGWSLAGESLCRVSLSGTFYLLLGVGRKTSSYMNERLLTGNVKKQTKKTKRKTFEKCSRL